VKDSGSIAKSVLKLLLDEELAMRMGEEGRRRAATLFDEEEVVGRQLAIYEHICTEL